MFTCCDACKHLFFNILSIVYQRTTPCSFKKLHPNNMATKIESIYPPIPASGTCTYGTLVRHEEYQVVYPGINASYVARNGLWARGTVQSTSGKRPLYSTNADKSVPMPTIPATCTSKQVTIPQIIEHVNKAYLD